jgi:hypothetical protein
MSKRPTKRELWHPVDTYDEQDIRSIQALALYAMGAERPWPAGQEPPVPSPMDVKRALDCIIYKLAQTYENGSMAAFSAQDPNVAWFIDGRRSVGQALTKLMVLKVAAFGGR